MESRSLTGSTLVATTCAQERSRARRDGPSGLVDAGRELSVGDLVVPEPGPATDAEQVPDARRSASRATLTVDREELTTSTGTSLSVSR